MSNRKPVIGCDMDGVMIDLLPEWLMQYYDMGGEWIPPESVTSYGWENFVTDKELFLKILKSGGVFYSAHPCNFASQGIEALQKIGDVVVVTKALPSSSRTFDAKLHSLWRHFPTIDFKKDVIFTGRKELVAADYLIEDSPENVDAWLARHPEGTGVLVSQSYNLDYSHERCMRVNNLIEAAERIAEWEERIK